ncbi:WYL domain-containing transcriptional regulator [Calothrix sp. UHCC 0171]|uniref:helix-turn-helix transcriptional regulator n=1 Tax=Calothrix sp. UHCC 0171 TaxID=3110245 RepID=UPI002B20F2A7|nr:WYL domain-containing transcriptional regulator [Calothrix sp. UHCC 0171]MEA5574691.1 WYL domain-containing transcriptional regulator [Calothrix sp. UHCC 0171]
MSPRHLERLLQLDELIRTKIKPTTVSLAKELEVSERTIRSDIAFLRDRYHAPLEYNSKLGHHYIEPEWRLPSVPLTKGELFALTVGAKMLETYAGSPYGMLLKTAITQLSQRLPEETWVNIRQLAEEHMIFGGGAEIDLNPEIWHNIEDACSQRRSVMMTYYTASRDDICERKLDPYLLHVYRGTNLYLIGYCHKRQQFRWFRVDRIRKLEILPEYFTPDPSFNAKEYIGNVFQHEVGDKLLDVEIWFDAKTAPYIKERRWHFTQEIETHGDNSMTLKMQVRGINDLKRWVMWYGKGAKVIRPQELVELVWGEVEEMRNNYNLLLERKS